MVPTQDLIERLLASTDSNTAQANLVDAGLWEDPQLWVPYGDSEANYGIVANQQSDPVGALVEKVVNGIDAILLKGCYLAGEDPVSTSAARTMTEAVEKYLGLPGPVHTWDQDQLSQAAQNLMVVVSGKSEGSPAIDVVDSGEGQHPDDFDSTFVSLNLVRKSRIPFVQGKYNMGSTGVLTFLGGAQMQMILSRRHPDLGGGPWGMTIVRRRFIPESGQSIWEFLAPGGKVLSWEASSMTLLPGEQTDKVFRPALHPLESGTMVRMWDYEEGPKPVIWGRKHSWKAMLEAMLPRMPIPAMIWDCREINDGESNQRSDLLLGASLRSGNKLTDTTGAVLSDTSEPTAAERTVVTVSYEGRIRDCRMVVEAHYRDLEDKAYGVRHPNPLQAGYGPVFYTVNGQTHSYEETEFFSRPEISALRSLQYGIMVYVDLTELKDSRAASKEVEDLFMASRDRPRNSVLFREIQSEVARLLGNSTELAELARQIRIRKAHASEEQSEESKNDLALMMDYVFIRSSSSFDEPDPEEEEELGVEPARSDKVVATELQKFPTFWYLDTPNPENTNIPVLKWFGGVPPNVRFVTDAQSDYFTRDDDPGSLSVSVVIDDTKMVQIESIPNRRDDGFEVELPSLGRIKAGDQVICRSVVSDPRREGDADLEPWINTWILEFIEPPQLPDKELFDLPNIPRWSWVPEVRMVTEDHWDSHDFDQFSGAHIEEGEERLTVFVNIDNRFLHNATERFESDEECELLRDTYCNLMAVHSTVWWRYAKMGNSRREPSRRVDPVEWAMWDSHKSAPAIVAAAVLHVRGGV